jgi:hypothetical protein
VAEQRQRVRVLGLAANRLRERESIIDLARQIRAVSEHMASADPAPTPSFSALALYRGPLLEGFPLRPREPLGEWFGGHRERLRDIARALMLRLLRSGEGSQALGERLIALDPQCEEAYRFLILRFAARATLPARSGDTRPAPTRSRRRGCKPRSRSVR